MSAKITDRRIKRTQDALMRAMQELIIEKGFGAMTIQELTDRANVGRSTFYQHYESKEDLLLSGFDELKAMLQGKTDNGTASAPKRGVRLLNFTTNLFQHLHENVSLFRAMAGRQGGALLKQGMEKMIEELVLEDLMRSFGGKNIQENEMLFACKMTAGAFSSLIPKWLGIEPVLPPTEVENTFRQYVLSGISAVMGLPKKAIK